MHKYKTPSINQFLLDIFGLEKLFIGYGLLINSANGIGFSKPVILNGISNANELEKFSLLIEGVSNEFLNKSCWYHPKYIPLNDIADSRNYIKRNPKSLMLHISQMHNTYINEDRFSDCLIVETKTPINITPWEEMFQELILFTSNLQDLK